MLSPLTASSPTASQPSDDNRAEATMTAGPCFCSLVMLAELWPLPSRLPDYAAASQ